MKKILAILPALILLLPLSASASITVPFTATSTDQGFITPALVNGKNFGLYILNKIGIGTSSPNHLLTLFGNDSTTNFLTTTQIEANLINADQTVNNTEDFGFNMVNSLGNVVTAAKIVAVNTSHAAGAESSDLVWTNRTAGTQTEKARLTSAGVFRLSALAGNAAGAFIATDPSGNLIATTTPSGGGGTAVGGTGAVQFANGTAFNGDNTQLTFLSPNFGIGTTTPSATLSVNAAPQSNAYFSIGSSTGNGRVLDVLPSAAPHLNIGTTSSAHTLDVSGNGFFESSASNAFSVGAPGTTTAAFNVNQSVGVGNGIEIDTAGAGNGIAINTTSANPNDTLTINTKGTGQLNLNTAGAGSIALNPAGVLRYTFGATQASLAPNGRSTAAANPFFVVTGGTGAALTTTVESTENLFNMTAIQSHASGAIVTERDFRIEPTTHTFTAGTTNANSTIASSTTFSIDGPPTQGLNVNYTNATGLFVGPGAGYTGSTSTSTAIVAISPLGAANNYALTSVGRVIHSGLTTSASAQSVLICGNAATGGELIAESVSCTASAARVKDDIASTTFSIDGLMHLRPVSFLWKKDWLNGDADPNVTGTQYSLVADEVQKVFPQLVAVTSATTSFEGKTYPAGTIQGLNDLNHWVSAIVSWLQQIVTRQNEQQIEIDQLKAQVQQLQQQRLPKQL